MAIRKSHSHGEKRDHTIERRFVILFVERGSFQHWQQLPSKLRPGVVVAGLVDYHAFLDQIRRKAPAVRLARARLARNIDRQRSVEFHVSGQRIVQVGPTYVVGQVSGLCILRELRLQCINPVAQRMRHSVQAIDFADARPVLGLHEGMLALSWARASPVMARSAASVRVAVKLCGMIGLVFSSALFGHDAKFPTLGGFISDSGAAFREALPLRKMQRIFPVIETICKRHRNFPA